MSKEKKNKKRPKEDRREKTSSTFKVAMITAISTLLIIAILLLLLLFGMKKCAGNSQSSSELPIDTERNNKITDIFKDIVEKKMTFDGFDTDELKSVVAVAYKDNYPTNFDLNIIVSSESKVYYYYSENVEYPDNKNGYDNFVSYLLLDTTSHALAGNITLAALEKTNYSINTSKTSYKAVVSQESGGNKYLSGFTYEDNSFFVYQKRLLTEGVEPFTGVGDQKIDGKSPLFDYYRGLLAV